MCVISVTGGGNRRWHSAMATVSYLAPTVTYFHHRCWLIFSLFPCSCERVPLLSASSFEADGSRWFGSETRLLIGHTLPVVGLRRRSPALVFINLVANTNVSTTPNTAAEDKYSISSCSRGWFHLLKGSEKMIVKCPPTIT